MANTADNSSSAPVLRVSGISKRFGGLQALSDVGMTIGRGQVYGLIGPNGAGKTTFFNVITGLYTPDSGSFELAGKAYEPTAVHKVAKAGIARTFQNIRLFAEMTALENVMVGRHVRTHSGLIGAVLRTRGFKAEEAAIRARARELLDYVGISKYADFKARTLSYGDQRRLEIARALATDPKFILLDEPFAGVDPIAVIEIQRIIRFLKGKGIGVLITDHNVRETLGICDHATILNNGEVLANGTPADIVDNTEVRQVYLGEHFRM